MTSPDDGTDDGSEGRSTDPTIEAADNYARVVTIELYRLGVLQSIDRHTEKIVRIVLRRAEAER